MFAVGDYIICGKNGVCRVEAVGKMELAGASSEKLYYTLCPVYSSGSRIFTPVDNEKVVIRSVLSEEEAMALIQEIPRIEELWVPDEKKREQIYKEALQSCNTREQIRIIKTLHLRRKNRIASGKKIPSVDDKYLRLAQEYLYGELSVSLDMTKDQVAQYVARQAGELEEICH